MRPDDHEPEWLTIVLTEDGPLVRFVEDGSSKELLSFNPIDRRVEDVSPLAAAAVSGLLPASTQFMSQLAESHALEVVFSPAVLAGLRTNAYRFMESGGRAMATVVDQRGQIIEVGRLAAPNALTVAASAPLLLVGAAGAVASYQQQRWLQDSLGQIQASVQRVEQRLRDDDRALLEANDRVADLVELAFQAGEWSDQLGTELAHARISSERILLSRQRFVERFGFELERAAAGERPGEAARSAVLRQLRDELRSAKVGLVEELATFFGALVVRARLNALTSTLLVQQGSPIVAYDLVSNIGVESRERFWSLFRRLQPFEHQPSNPNERARDRAKGTLRELLGADSSDEIDALRDLIAHVRPIGDRLLGQENELTIVVPVSQLSIMN